MAILTIQTWRPDTHAGHIVEEEWEYDPETARDTGREHRCVSIRYPDDTYVHRDTHGADVLRQHYQKLRDEHVVKNQAYGLISEALPAHMKKPVLDSDGDPILDNSGEPRLTVKDKHRPRFKHLGNGRYEFVVPGIDEATHCELAAKLVRRFSDNVLLLKPAS